MIKCALTQRRKKKRTTVYLLKSMHKTRKECCWTVSLCMAESMKTDIKKENEYDKYSLSPCLTLPHSAPSKI